MNLFMTIGVPGSGKLPGRMRKPVNWVILLRYLAMICVALCIMLVKVLADTNTPKRKKK